MLDAIFYIRIVVSIILGFVIGFIPLKGVAGFFAYAMGLLLVLVGYARSFQGNDDAELGEIVSEAFLPGTALFIIFWTLSFNIFN